MYLEEILDLLNCKNEVGNVSIFRFWRWAIQDTLLSLVVTRPRQGATPLNPEHILPKQAATPLDKVDTPHKAAILQQQGATPHRQVDTHPRLAVTLLQQEVTPQQQGATLPRLAATLPQLEASHLNQEDTSRSLQQGVIPPCPQQVRIGFEKLNSFYTIFGCKNKYITKDTLRSDWCYVDISFAGGGWGATPAGYGAVSNILFLKSSGITAEGG